MTKLITALKSFWNWITDIPEGRTCGADPMFNDRCTCGLCYPPESLSEKRDAKDGE